MNTPRTQQEAIQYVYNYLSTLVEQNKIQSKYSTYILSLTPECIHEIADSCRRRFTDEIEDKLIPLTIGGVKILQELLYKTDLVTVEAVKQYIHQRATDIGANFYNMYITYKYNPEGKEAFSTMFPTKNPELSPESNDSLEIKDESSINSFNQSINNLYTLATKDDFNQRINAS